MEAITALVSPTLQAVRRPNHPSLLVNICPPSRRLNSVSSRHLNVHAVACPILRPRPARPDNQKRWSDPMILPGDFTKRLENWPEFAEAADNGNLVPLCRCIISDHLTPVLAYRSLVAEDEKDKPSFLFEYSEPGNAFVSEQVFIFSVD
ncbi:Anthranilate synthase alpha subunit 2, chloroplastic-like protein [Drosera capensis]